MNKGGDMSETHEIRHFEEMIRKGTDDINCYFKLASLYFDKGKYEEVLSLYNGLSEKKLTIIEQGRVLYEKGVACQILNRIEDALSFFRISLKKIQKVKDSIEALDIKGLNFYSIFNLSQSEEEKIRYATKALDCFNKLKTQFKVREEDYSVNSYLAGIYEKIGQYDNSLNLYNEIIESSTDLHDRVWAMVGAASIYELKGDYQNSLTCLIDALKRAGNTVPTSKIYFDLGKLHFTTKVYEAAKEAFQNALFKMKEEILLKDNEEYKIDISWYLGSIAYNLGENEDFISYFTDLLRKIGTNHFYYPNINITLGHFYSEKNDFIKSRYYYEKARLSETISEEELKMVEECLTRIA